MGSCLTQIRSLPYAAALTPIFKEVGVDLNSELESHIPKGNRYSLSSIKTFMGFKIVDGQPD